MVQVFEVAKRVDSEKFGDRVPAAIALLDDLASPSLRQPRRADIL
jgi:hypothetical protein